MTQTAEDGLGADSAIGEIHALLRSIAAYCQQNAAAFAKRPDATIFDGFPGPGNALARAGWLSSDSTRDRFPKPETIQQPSGIAPVTESSGTTKRVHRRYACARTLLQGFRVRPDSGFRGNVVTRLFATPTHRSR